MSAEEYLDIFTTDSLSSQVYQNPGVVEKLEPY